MGFINYRPIMQIEKGCIPLRQAEERAGNVGEVGRKVHTPCFIYFIKEEKVVLFMSRIDLQTDDLDALEQELNDIEEELSEIEEEVSDFEEEGITGEFDEYRWKQCCDEMIPG